MDYEEITKRKIEIYLLILFSSLFLKYVGLLEKSHLHVLTMTMTLPQEFI